MTYRWPIDDPQMTYRLPTEDYQETNIDNISMLTLSHLQTFGLVHSQQICCQLLGNISVRRLLSVKIARCVHFQSMFLDANYSHFEVWMHLLKQGQCPSYCNLCSVYRRLGYTRPAENTNMMIIQTEQNKFNIPPSIL